MRPIQLVYLALAIWGTIHPMSYFIPWFQENTWSLVAMAEAWHANKASSGLVWDLTIAAIALTIWIIVETIQRRRWFNFVAILATFGIGVSCGLPLYLYLRSRSAA